MSNESNQDLVVGLDAGGTRIRAVLASAATGRTLGEAAAGPGNALTVPLSQLTDHLAEAIGRAVPERDRDRVVAVVGGFAGAASGPPAAGSSDEGSADPSELSGPPDLPGFSDRDPGRLNALAALAEAQRRLGVAPRTVGVSSDIEAAFASAPGTPADGLALVAGTGAAATRISGRRCTVSVDGDGWLLGDEGSGFWIGRGAVRAALRMADGRGDPTTLARSVGLALGLPADLLEGAEGVDGVYEAHETDGVDGGGAGAVEGAGGAGAPRRYGPGRGAAGASRWSRARREAFRTRLLPTVMAQPPVALARLAPLVAEAARRKDPVATAILREAVDHLTAAVRALDPRPGERIVVTGGLLGPDGPLAAPLTRRLEGLGLTVDRVADGCRGAVALARLGHGSPSHAAGTS
ncbi:MULTISPECIES: N-acetylglucosamine kinase [unclassified Streptomyces]|uniref:N-acetylglucosamine kinase n=1 Tax=unclassified Streptomyces TaxID=2593676 RepID=UPI002E32BCAB|nr:MULTISPECIES: BadF/BadG/BcrA/BcrD ATPase family protein [unclassified Streptomyces]